MVIKPRPGLSEPRPRQVLKRWPNPAWPERVEKKKKKKKKKKVTTGKREKSRPTATPYRTVQ